MSIEKWINRLIYDHIEEDRLIAYVENLDALSYVRRSLIEAHLSKCPICSRKLRLLEEILAHPNVVQFPVIVAEIQMPLLKKTGRTKLLRQGQIQFQKGLARYAIYCTSEGGSFSIWFGSNDLPDGFKFLVKGIDWEQEVMMYRVEGFNETKAEVRIPSEKKIIVKDQREGDEPDGNAEKPL